MFRSDFLTFMSSVFDSISSVARLALATPHPVTCIPYFKDHFHFPRLESFVLKPLETFSKPVPYTKGKSKKLKKRGFPDMLREIIVGQNILGLYQFPALKSLQIVTDEDIGDNAPDASISQESYEWLESVQELTLLGKWHRAFPCAQDLLKSCINLRCLSFGSSYVEDVPDLLDTLKSDPALLPCLSTLVLHNPTFDPDDRSNDGESDDDSNIFEDDEEEQEEDEDAVSFGSNWYEPGVVLEHLGEMVKVRCALDMQPSQRLQEVVVDTGLLDILEDDHQEQDFYDSLEQHTSNGLRISLDGCTPQYEHPTEKLLTEWKIEQARGLVVFFSLFGCIGGQLWSV